MNNNIENKCVLVQKPVILEKDVAPKHVPLFKNIINVNREISPISGVHQLLE